MTALPYVLLGGGALLVARADGTHGAAPVVTPRPKPVGGASSGMPVGAKVAALNRGAGSLIVGGAKPKVAVTPSVAPSPLVSRGGGQFVAQVDAATRGQLRQLEAQAKAKYDALSASAKKTAAAKLNEIRPSPGLTGEESWDEAAQKVGAAVGTIAGGAVCNAIPIPGVATVAAGTVCATLGAMVGAYLGETLGDWSKKAYAEIRSAADKAWHTVEDAASDVVHGVGSGVSAAVDFVGDLF